MRRAGGAAGAPGRAGPHRPSGLIIGAADNQARKRQSYRTGWRNSRLQVWRRAKAAVKTRRPNISIAATFGHTMKNTINLGRALAAAKR